MYLAKLETDNEYSFQIRKSIPYNIDQFTYKKVIDLGSDPTDHFEIFEDYVILFDSQLLSAIQDNSDDDPESILERLLWDFFPRDIQDRLSRFLHRKGATPSKISTQEIEDIARQIHIFDRRRLYYLRYGALDQSRLSRLHEKCCKPLLNMSRDEKEFYFRSEEKVIEPGKYLQYVYAIFDLQKHFTESFATWLPESLAREEMSHHFVEELCRLNENRNFWDGEKIATSLHTHLQRYLVMFFDYRPAPRNYFNDFARSFMADHRKFQWPERPSPVSAEQMSEIFGLHFDKLKAMDKEHLNKLYRKKAMELHPDRGGDHQQFIELTEAYNSLLARAKVK